MATNPANPTGSLSGVAFSGFSDWSWAVGARPQYSLSDYFKLVVEVGFQQLKPKKDMVAAHLVNLAWNGLSHLETKPTLLTRKTR